MDQGDMDMTVKAPLHTGDVSDGGFADVLASAVEKLRNGVLEEAHRLLVRLIRKHNTDADVIFNLAVARKRLGYDVSADALFTQAFENGYAFPSDSPAQPIDDKPGFFRWTDPTDTVAIIVRQRPRRSSLTFVGFDREDAPVKNEAPASTDPPVDAPDGE